MKTLFIHKQSCDCDICFYQKKILREVCEKLLKFKIIFFNTKSDDFMEGLGFGVREYFKHINNIMEKNLK